MLPYNVRSAMESMGGILKHHPNPSSSTDHLSSRIASRISGSNATHFRPGETRQRQVDLLVFGYACKVFRDDEKAKEIDQGKHLIPWMGDNSLKIDRYDVRGALYELATHEPPPGGYGNRLDYLSADEQRAEQLCEEERYLFLYMEEELVLQQEEELKRLRQETNGSYKQVEFSYNGEDGVNIERDQQTVSPGCEEAEEAFKVPNNFTVPPDIDLPETMKQHAIIEKTARFIASQGTQMEILLKAKQSNNLQFEFLNATSSLNAYYKYIMNAIKDGTYPERESVSKIGSDVAAESVTTEEESTLFNMGVIQKEVITVPAVKYKPSVNCAYTQLISKITGVPLPMEDENTNCLDNLSPTATPTPVLLQYNGSTTTFVTEADSNSNSNSNLFSNPNSNNTANISADDSTRVELLMNSSALAMAQNYNSDTETEDDENVKQEEVPKNPEPELHFPIPEETLKNIIDKTAVYVIKNGRQFEETLRSKSEERFTFLLAENMYYPYYMYKITGDPDAASKEQKTRKAAAVAAALLSKKGLNKDKSVTAPVSFSIKPKDDNSVGSMQPALPQDVSDEEDQQTLVHQQQTFKILDRNVPEQVQKAIQLVESQLMARDAKLKPSPRSRFDITYSNVAGPSNSSQVNSSPNPHQDRSTLFEQQEQTRHKELKKAEEKVKDKLAQIAREKLGGLLSKEKQLQMERKRKAAAFLNQIKETVDTQNNISNDDEKHSPVKLKKGEVNAESDDSEVSVQSIPITSYGPEDQSHDEQSVDELAADNKTTVPSTSSALALQKQLHEEVHLGTPKTTFTVSDDDDVQLVHEIKAPLKTKTIHLKRSSKSKSKRSSRSQSRSISKSQENGLHAIRHKKKRSVSVDSSESYMSDSSMGSSSSKGGVRKHRSSTNRKHHSKSSKYSSTHKHKKKTKKRERTPSPYRRDRASSPRRRHNKHHKHSRTRSPSRSRYSSETEIVADKRSGRNHCDEQLRSPDYRHCDNDDYCPSKHSRRSRLSTK